MAMAVRLFFAALCFFQTVRLGAWEGRAELGGGPAQLFSQGLSSHYDSARALPGFQHASVDSVAVYFGLEADFEHSMLLQLGVNFGPTFDMRQNSPAGFSYSETFNLSNTYILPGLRFRLGASDFSACLGLPLGYSFLSGSGNYSDASGSSVSRIGGWAFSYGVTARLEYAFIEWISVGTDFNYTQAGLITAQSTLDSGSNLYSLPAPSIDSSGARCRIYLSLHPNMPAPGKARRHDTGPLGKPEN